MGEITSGFVKWCGGWDEDDRIVRVRHWMPSFDRSGMWWPTVLVDRRTGQRETSTPLWPWPWRRTR